MKIKFNGKEIELINVKTITDLISSMNIKEKIFVIEKNLEIISKSDYSKVFLKDGDSVEVIAFASGG